MYANGHVYETFGISKHFPVKLQLHLIRTKMLDNTLTAKYFMYDVWAGLNHVIIIRRFINHLKGFKFLIKSAHEVVANSGFPTFAFDIAGFPIAKE